MVYIIENEKVKLDLECNGGGQIDSDGNYQDHYLNIMVNQKELKLDSKKSLEFLIDGEIAAFSFQDRANFVSTNWRNGANSWNEFIELLSTAKNIEIKKGMFENQSSVFKIFYLRITRELAKKWDGAKLANWSVVLNQLSILDETRHEIG